MRIEREDQKGKGRWEGKGKGRREILVALYSNVGALLKCWRSIQMRHGRMLGYINKLQ